MLRQLNWSSLALLLCQERYAPVSTVLSFEQTLLWPNESEAAIHLLLWPICCYSKTWWLRRQRSLYVCHIFNILYIQAYKPSTFQSLASSIAYIYKTAEHIRTGYWPSSCTREMYYYMTRGLSGSNWLLARLIPLMSHLVSSANTYFKSSNK